MLKSTQNLGKEKLVYGWVIKCVKNWYRDGQEVRRAHLCTPLFKNTPSSSPLDISDNLPQDAYIIFQKKLTILK